MLLIKIVKMWIHQKLLRQFFFQCLLNMSHDQFFHLLVFVSFLFFCLFVCLCVCFSLVYVLWHFYHAKSWFTCHSAGRPHLYLYIYICIFTLLNPITTLIKPLYAFIVNSPWHFNTSMQDLVIAKRVISCNCMVTVVIGLLNCGSLSFTSFCWKHKAK